MRRRSDDRDPPFFSRAERDPFSLDTADGSDNTRILVQHRVRVTAIYVPENASIAYNDSMQPSEPAMSTLTIRNLDARVKEGLRVRAARNGRSMEAEVRSILAETLAPQTRAEPDLAEAIRRRFASVGGVELEPHPPVAIAEPPRFER